MLAEKSFGRPTACNACPAFQLAEWKLLPQSEIKTLTKTKRSKSYLPGETLFSAGDTSEGVFCIQDGRVGLWSLNLEGDIALRYIFGPGEIVGLIDLVSNQAYNMFCKAINQTRACFIQKNLVKRLINEQPVLCAGFLKKTASQIVNLEEFINDINYLPLKARFCKLLTKLIMEYEEVGDGKNINFCIPVKKKTIASMLHSRPESISRIIQQLRNENILSFSGNLLHIPELSKLIKEFN